MCVYIYRHVYTQRRKYAYTIRHFGLGPRPIAERAAIERVTRGKAKAGPAGSEGLAEFPNRPMPRPRERKGQRQRQRWRERQRWRQRKRWWQRQGCEASAVLLALIDFFGTWCEEASAVCTWVQSNPSVAPCSNVGQASQGSLKLSHTQS